MKRRKITKVRTTISLDAQVFEESGYYIYNLSAFVEECIRREIEKQKKKGQLRISANKQTNKTEHDELIKILESYPDNKKRTTTNDDISVDDLI